MILKQIFRYLFVLIYSIYLRKNKVTVKSKVNLNYNTSFGGNNIINKKTNIINSSIGFASYIGEDCFLPNSQIGKYCSIASNVKLLPYTHPTHNFVSTHPCFYSTLKQSGFTFVKIQKFKEILYFNSKEKLFIKIGNDVWIGNDVKLIGGIEIGDGAIIAAGAFVTKNVQPYEIVGGLPAKTIRFRFSQEQILELLNVKWWDLPFEIIRKNSEIFDDINNFIKCKEFFIKS